MLSRRSRPTLLSIQAFIFAFTIGSRLRQDFIRDVVSVLLGIERPPWSVESFGHLTADQPVGRWIAVGLMPACDLIVAVICESRQIDRGVCQVLKIYSFLYHSFVTSAASSPP